MRTWDGSQGSQLASGGHGGHCSLAPTTQPATTISDPWATIASRTVSCAAAEAIPAQAFRARWTPPQDQRHRTARARVVLIGASCFLQVAVARSSSDGRSLPRPGERRRPATAVGRGSVRSRRCRPSRASRVASAMLAGWADARSSPRSGAAAWCVARCRRATRRPRRSAGRRDGGPRRHGARRALRSSGAGRHPRDRSERSSRRRARGPAGAAAGSGARGSPRSNGWLRPPHSATGQAGTLSWTFTVGCTFSAPSMAV